MAAMKNALHFVGFKDPRYEKDPRYHRAVQVFGRPDFHHRVWDGRAKQDIAPGDVAVFATGTEADKPCLYSFDDSSMF